MALQPSAHLLAHAFGQRYDLPIPLVLFVVGGGAVVFLSFLLVLPRPVAGGRAPAIRDTGWAGGRSVAGGVAAWVVLVLLLVCGWAGSQEISENILPTLFWLVVWIAVPLSCGLIGDWTRRVNPFAVVARLLDRPSLRRTLFGGEATVTWPERAGFWPAVVLYFAIACGELVYNDVATVPAVTATGLAIYAAVSAFAGLTFGAERWLERGEVFSVLWSTWGRLGFFRFGARGRRGFGGGLDTGFDPSAGRVTFVLLLLTSVSFDGLLATPAWKTVRLHLSGGFAPGSAGYKIGETIAFAVLVGLAWMLFGAFAAGVRAAGRLGGSALAALAGLLPSLLPISFGYLLAHNIDYLAINGQLLIPLIGNPTGHNQWLPAPFDDSYQPTAHMPPSAPIWYIALVVIVLVHIAAVVLAHRHLGRAARNGELARRSEWPWIVVMVGYTMTSLWLLAQPLVEEKSGAALRSAGGLLATLLR